MGLARCSSGLIDEPTCDSLTWAIDGNAEVPPFRRLGPVVWRGPSLRGFPTFRRSGPTGGGIEAGPGPGWGHLSSWAHYGARQTGICLGFNLDALLEQFHKVGGDDALRVHGPVRYWEFEHEQYLESVQSHYPRTYGTDAIARHYAEQYGDLIFLSKNSDWSSEYEYRLALMNKSTLPAHIDIRPALAGVVVGSRFSEGLRAALFEALADYEGIEAAQIYQRNRHSMVIPYRAREGYGGSKFVPASSGGLLERVALLRDEETLSGRNRTRPA